MFMTVSLTDLREELAASLHVLERLAMRSGGVQLRRLAVARRHALARLGRGPGRLRLRVASNIVDAEWHLVQRLAVFAESLNRKDPLRGVVEDIQCEVAESALILTRLGSEAAHK
jgi:hypothetical protein